MNNWKQGGELYLGLFAQAERQYSIPTDLLARIGFQECSWRLDVISGKTHSPAGAVGIMQMEPAYFSHVDLTQPRAAIPIGAVFLRSLHRRFNDWQAAVAAYNWGPGSVHRSYVEHGNEYVLADFPEETQNYVIEVFTDVPIAGALIEVPVTLTPRRTARTHLPVTQQI